MSSDAIVVGSGPNGLSAAIVLASHGLSVTVYEGNERIGGGTRTEELTLPGFRHDVCSAIHPLGLGSPFFQSLPLDAYGLQWIHSPTVLAHPFADGTAVTLERDTNATADALGADAAAYQRLLQPFLRNWESLLEDALGPLHFPRHPLVLARFGLLALRSAEQVMKRFRGDRARALFAGMAAHSLLPLSEAPTAAFGLVLALAGHAVGWPLARGGSAAITTALAAHLKSLGGEIVTATPVRHLDELPKSRVVLLDLTPRQILRIAGNRLPVRYQRALQKYRYGPGSFKMDWALSGPIPWRAKQCGSAATVHLIGGPDQMLEESHAAWRGEHVEQPFVLLAQPTLFDPSRAPPGAHVAWAYCHVPHASPVDMSGRIEAQIERFAPGFRDLILARSVRSPAQLEAHNPNLVGGDITGGVQDLRQLFARPARRRVPYATPVKGLYICSASTPPGGGVHGMCGYHAAQAVLRDKRVFAVQRPG